MGDSRDNEEMLVEEERGAEEEEVAEDCHLRYTSHLWPVTRPSHLWPNVSQTMRDDHFDHRRVNPILIGY